VTSPQAPLALHRCASQIWALLEPRERRQCAGVVAVSVAAGAFTLCGVAGIAPLLAVLSDPSVVARVPIVARLAPALSTDQLELGLAAAFMLALVLGSVANLLSSLTIGRFAQQVSARLQALLFADYLYRGLRFHASINRDESGTLVTYEVHRAVSGLIQNGLLILASAASIALIAAAVLYVNPAVAGAAALAICATYALIYALLRPRLLRDGAAIAALWNERARLVAESFAAIGDVTLAGAQAVRAAEVARQSRSIAEAQSRTAAIASAPKYAIECVAMAGLVIAALWMKRASGGSGWLPELAFLGLAAYRLLPPVQQWYAAAARLRSDCAGFEQIAAQLRSARARECPAVTPVERDAWRSRPRCAIELRGLSYRHSVEREGGVVGVSARLPAGALIGLVGPNGSGKTTLANLVLGVLVPDAGSVHVDGLELHERNRHLWHTAVAHVPQQIVLLDASVAHNVAFGAEVDLARVRAAVRDARLESFVARLPQGLATPVGANGARLSGGQRQRLAIARALYRRASLLVIDEGTSALDPSAEADLVALLRSLRGQCTTLWISHGAAALRGCDFVLELDAGRLASRSDHADGPRRLPESAPRATRR
jgi:ATP-binding cassette subfamily B protein